MLPSTNRWRVSNADSARSHRKHLLSCGRDTVVRIWQLSDWKPIKELGKRRGSDFDGYSWIHAVSLAADGLWLAAADMGGEVQVWSIPAAM